MLEWFVVGDGYGVTAIYWYYFNRNHIWYSRDGVACCSYNNSVHTIIFNIMIFSFFWTFHKSFLCGQYTQTHTIWKEIFFYKFYGIFPQLDRSISIYVPMNVRHIWHTDHKNSLSWLSSMFIDWNRFQSWKCLWSRLVHRL